MQPYNHVEGFEAHNLFVLDRITKSVRQTHLSPSGVQQPPRLKEAIASRNPPLVHRQPHADFTTLYACRQSTRRKGRSPALLCDCTRYILLALLQTPGWLPLAIRIAFTIRRG
jgi:hypothetical protein